jgi:hypothetical protein
MPQLTFAQQRAEDKLNRRGLQTNPETGEVEPMPKKEEPAGNADQDDQTQQQAAATPSPAASPTPTPAPAAGGDAELRAMFQQLQADHEALKGRLAPAQRDADTFRGLYETSSRELTAARESKDSELANLRAELDAATSARERKSIEAEIDELLTQEDLDTVDPSVLAVIRKVAGKFAGNKAPVFDTSAAVEKALAERDRKVVDAHRGRILADQNTELGKLKALSQDPEFNAYCEENPEVDMTLTHFLHASTTADIDRYAKAATRLISAYRTGKTPKEEPRAADPRGSTSAVLTSALARTAAVKMSEEQLREKTREFKQLIRNNNPESKAKAKLLMAEIEANT